MNRPMVVALFVCVRVQVCVRQEERRVDSQEYGELQSLYQESERRLKQVSPPD